MKRNIVLKSCITSCLIASMAQNVYAEEVAVEKSESTHKLDQVVVTATRTEKLLEDVSANMEVITSEDIKKLGAFNIVDALRKASNIAIDSRNVRIRAMSGNHTLILLNGRKMSPEVAPSNTARNALDKINVNSIERIEIIRGPASVLYGSDALGGVINIITKKSTEPSLLVGVVTDSEDFHNYYTYDTGKMGNWDAIFNARFTNSPKKIKKDEEGNESLDRNGFRAFLAADIGYELSENQEIRLTTDYYNYNWNAFRDNGKYVENVSSNYIGSALTYKGNTEKNNFSVTGSYSRAHDNIKEGNSEDEEGIRIINDYFTTYSIDAQNTYSLNDMNLITFGGEYKNTEASADDSRVDDESIDYIAAYIQDELSFLDETLFISPAVRYDHYSDFGGQFSPKLGATYKINNNNRLKANYGFGFRAPSIEETHRDAYFFEERENEHVYIVGNPDLKPEESIGWDITYEGEYKNTFGSVTYFNNDITNLIEGDRIFGTHPDGNGTVTNIYKNIAKADISGVETKLGVDFLNYFTLQGEYYYTDARDNEDNPLGNTPKHKYIATFMYNDSERGNSAIIWSEWNREEEVRRSRGKFINYNVLNATVTKTWKDKYTFYAGVDNILDSGTTEEEYYVNSDRTWRAGFEMKF